MSKHSHYKKDVSHLRFIDVYRVLELFGVTHPARQHAIKKLLCAGQRGLKDLERDLREAVDSVHRELQMIAEDVARAPNEPTGLLDVPIGPELQWPDGANWFARNADGEGWFYSEQPRSDRATHRWQGDYVGPRLPGTPSVHWRQHVYKRPD